MKRAALLALLVAAPVLAQSFADGTTFGGSSVFSLGANPSANPARFDQLPEGFYLGADLGDVKPRGTQDAGDALVAAEGDASLLPAALTAYADHPWAERKKAYGLAWAWAGGIRFGFTHADLRGTFGAVDEALPQLTLDARHAVVDRLYAGAGSLAGRTAFGFTVRLERVRFGQAAFALVPSPTQLPLGDPSTPLDGVPLSDTVTSATVDLGLTQEVGPGLRFGLALDRIASRRFGDLKESPQARAGLQMDLSASWKLSVESDVNASERLPFAVKARTQGASLLIQLTPAATFTVGAERHRFEGAPASTVLGAAFHYRAAPLMVSLGFRFGDDHPLAAAAFRLPGAP